MTIIPELGHFALVLALIMAVLLTIVPAYGVLTRQTIHMQLAPSLALGYCCFIALAYVALTIAFIGHDFSVIYVANNSNTDLPLMFRISAVWSGHEGSLLLWVLMLSGWTAAAAQLSHQLPLATRARILVILGFIGIGFLLFILLLSNPFERLLPFFPEQGRDLNPLLQDFALIIHPPMLYMGYVGLAVSFALAVAALWEGRADSSWARWVRPWTLVSWAFLTLGITLGSWWAYYELGWGGWWFWDPVENASLMPWLISTALIHSLIVTEHRQLLKSWTLLLAILAFSLSLLGTFLVRSGVLTSIHAFANDPERGAYILIFMAIVVGGSLLLYAWRAKQLHASGQFAALSRESLLLSNNIILVIACATVLLGTLYPLLLDAFNLGLISIGPPYFNSVFVPLCVVLLSLMALGPMSRWKQMSPSWVVQRLRYVILTSVMVGILLSLLFSGQLKWQVALGLVVSLCLIISTIEDARRRASQMQRGWAGLTKSYYGMMLAHIGVAVMAIGVVISSHYSLADDQRLLPGEQVQLGDYRFQFDGVDPVTGPNYQAVEATFRVYRQQQFLRMMYPQRRLNNAQQILTTKTAIDPGLWRDLYIALGEQFDNGSWAVRIQYKPFVRWIWLGGLLMVLGGVVAIFDRRYRR